MVLMLITLTLNIFSILFLIVFLLAPLFTLKTILLNSDNVVDFSVGTKDVFCTMPASKTVYLDASGNPVGAASAGFALAMAVAL